MGCHWEIPPAPTYNPHGKWILYSRQQVLARRLSFAAKLVCAGGAVGGVSFDHLPAAPPPPVLAGPQAGGIDFGVPWSPAVLDVPPVEILVPPPPVSTPEPSTFLLLGISVLGILVLRR